MKNQMSKFDQEARDALLRMKQGQERPVLKLQPAQVELLEWVDSQDLPLLSQIKRAYLRALEKSQIMEGEKGNHVAKSEVEGILQLAHNILAGARGDQESGENKLDNFIAWKI